MSVRFGVDMSVRIEENKMSTPTENSLRLRLEELELVIVCARDIVNAWPDLSIRTLGQMTKRIDTLRQALEAAKK
jgi:hypothetical protein